MTYLIDSNIFIYAGNADSDEDESHQFLAGLNTFFFASVTKIEVLGYHLLEEEDMEILESIFGAGRELQLSERVKQRAIKLRQQRKMSLGDSIVAASALIHDVILVTRNVSDFKHVGVLQLLDPYQQRNNL